VAAQILGLGAFDNTNSAQIIGTGPGICAVMGGAGVTEVKVGTVLCLNISWEYFEAAYH